TIGGALGGILFALVTGSIFHLVSPLDYSFVSIVGITVLISVVGQIGDLVASAMKRHYQVKDSGKIFPGHGGILDRLDSLLFVLLMLILIDFVEHFLFGFIFLVTVFSFIIMFGLLVSVHEWGHLIFAISAGMLAREFAIVFRPKIFDF